MTPFAPRPESPDEQQLDIPAEVHQDELEAEAWRERDPHARPTPAPLQRDDPDHD